MKTTHFISLALITVIFFMGFIIPGQNNPNIPNAISSSIPAGDTLLLWNGVNLDGLEIILKTTNPETDKPYKIKDSVLYFYGKQTGYFRTKEIFSNYSLHTEWRWPEMGENANSGILVHTQGPDSVWPGCIQVQLKKDNAGDIIAMNRAALKETTGKPKETAVKFNASNEKPEGQWNSCDVFCRGDSVLVYINGLLQNKATASSLTKGTIGFQLEGKPVEFRNIRLIKK